MTKKLVELFLGPVLTLLDRLGRMMTSRGLQANVRNKYVLQQKFRADVDVASEKREDRSGDVSDAKNHFEHCRWLP